MDFSHHRRTIYRYNWLTQQHQRRLINSIINTIEDLHRAQQAVFKQLVQHQISTTTTSPRPPPSSSSSSFNSFSSSVDYSFCSRRLMNLPANQQSNQQKIIIFIGKFSNILPSILQQHIRQYFLARSLWFNIKTIRQSRSDNRFFAFVEVYNTSANSIITDNVTIAAQSVRISAYNPPAKYY